MSTRPGICAATARPVHVHAGHGDAREV